MTRGSQFVVHYSLEKLTKLHIKSSFTSSIASLPYPKPKRNNVHEVEYIMATFMGH